MLGISRVRRGNKHEHSMHRDTEHRAKQIQNKADTVGEQREVAKGLLLRWC